MNVWKKINGNCSCVLKMKTKIGKYSFPPVYVIPFLKMMYDLGLKKQQIMYLNHRYITIKYYIRNYENIKIKVLFFLCDDLLNNFTNIII